ncbi:MAG: hypothetical protein IKH27_13705 [Oscillospiraceae bacterium]|nr:hypothetical protein [Oscillospiraceae bacterium]
MDEKFYTPYTKTEILRAFRRALGDLTDPEVFALIRNEETAREAADNALDAEITAVAADLSANYARADALAAETAARSAADTAHEAVLAVLSDSAPKNAVNVGTVSGQTVNGITWTVDAANGTVTANGTASGNSFFYVWPVNSNVPYAFPTVLSGCPSGGGASAYELQAAIGSTVYHDYGSGTEIPAGTIRYITCCIRSGNTVSDLVFHPMLCPAALQPDPPQFVPYCPTLPELYRMMLQGRSAASAEQVRSAEGSAALRPETEADDA